MALVCPLCPLEKALRLPFNTKDYLKHVRLFHSHQPIFHITCGISECQRMFVNFYTFRKHVFDHHSDDPNPTNCCMHSILAQFLECDFTLGDKVSHERQCSELHGASNSDASKLYGVNRNSILNELSYCHVCSGALLPDVMHNILEGALQYEVKLVLREMVYEEQYFTLDNLNTRIVNLELGLMEVKDDRPTQIWDTTLRSSSGVSLKQAGTFFPPFLLSTFFSSHSLISDMLPPLFLSPSFLFACSCPNVTFRSHPAPSHRGLHS